MSTVQNFQTSTLQQIIQLSNAVNLTLSSIDTHFNALKKKLKKNIVEKGEFAHFAQSRLFPKCFPCIS